MATRWPVFATSRLFFRHLLFIPLFLGIEITKVLGALFSVTFPIVWVSHPFPVAFSDYFFGVTSPPLFPHLLFIPLFLGIGFTKVLGALF